MGNAPKRSDRAGQAGVYVALLRGANVGGRNRLAMAELVRILEEAGGRDVQTVIQSGNAVFRLASAKTARFAEDVAARIERELGFRPPVVLRNAGVIAKISEAHPLAGAEVPEKALHVAFLDRKPEPAAVARLDPARSPGDRFVVRGSEVFLSLPRGVAESRLTTAYVDSTLSVVSTWRNWNTVQKLRGMVLAPW